MILAIAQLGEGPPRAPAAREAVAGTPERLGRVNKAYYGGTSGEIWK